MQLIDQEHKRVTDFIDSEAHSNTNNPAKSSAFAFFPKYSLVSRVSGNAGKSVDPLKKHLIITGLKKIMNGMLFPSSQQTASSVSKKNFAE